MASAVELSRRGLDVDFSCRGVLTRTHAPWVPTLICDYCGKPLHREYGTFRYFTVSDHHILEEEELPW